MILIHTINHNGKKRFEIGRDSVFIRIGGVTIKTHQLRKRLMQAGCIYATGGSFITCAPDVLDREIKKIQYGQFRGVVGYNNSGVTRESPTEIAELRRITLEAEQVRRLGNAIIDGYIEDKKNMALLLLI